MRSNPFHPGRPFVSPYSTPSNDSYVPTTPVSYAHTDYDFRINDKSSYTANMPSVLEPHSRKSVGFPTRIHSGSDVERQRQGFSDALDASRGMVAMSQSETTPRNIYDAVGFGSPARLPAESYGFPVPHSSHSSVSSAGVSEASNGGYSSPSESVDTPERYNPTRSYGMPPGVERLPPAPHSMMGQFSTKSSPGSNKKHKCQVCDKRFTRPSSLQTHMYSHTGEKRAWRPPSPSLYPPFHPRTDRRS